MERRNFLKGIIGGTAAAGGLIITASPADLEAFAAPIGLPVALAPTPSEPLFNMFHGDFLYDRRGNPIAVVTEVRISHPYVDASTFESPGSKLYVTGFTEVEIRALGLHQRMHLRET